MSFNSLEGIDEILRYLGYEKSDNSDENIDSSDNNDTNDCKDLNLDILGGFQDMSPLLFITVGELLENIIAGQLPFNIANAVANYIILIGQIIEAYGTQQIYQEFGPGRYYNPEFKNIDNPICTNEEKSKEDNSINEIKIEIKKLICDLRNLTNRIDKLEKNIEN